MQYRKQDLDDADDQNELAKSCRAQRAGQYGEIKNAENGTDTFGRKQPRTVAENPAQSIVARAKAFQSIQNSAQDTKLSIRNPGSRVYCMPLSDFETNFQWSLLHQGEKT